MPVPKQTATATSVAAPIVTPLPALPVLPAPNRSTDDAILAILRSIQADIASIRQKQDAFDAKLVKLDHQQQRLEDRLDGVPDDYEYGDDQMDAESANETHNDAQHLTTTTDG